jgi:single-stranded-DNA-specific exonuclease
VAQVVRKIKLREQRESEAQRIADSFSLGSVASRVIAARGYQANDNLKLFLSPSLKEGLPSPKNLKNLEAASALIESVVNAGQKIAICCDFDVDGLSGGSQLQALFQEIGATSKVFVPDRFEDGYGLNVGMIEEIVAEGFSLIITVDFGTTNAKELDRARELGAKTIVIDHHHVGTNKTPADIFINPHQEGCGFADKIMSAAGLAWYTVVGITRFTKIASNVDPKNYLDLACLGTICDMVPLVGVNRIIARRGLELMESTRRVGLAALKNIVGVKDKVSCHHISFGIGPRINAAGRMINGDIVVELLTTDNSKRAASIASRLDRLNKQRQEKEEQIKKKAHSEIEKAGAVPSGLVLWDSTYHTGVIGLVAQRLVEAYYRPAAVMGTDKEGILKGSVRGIPGFSVVDTLHKLKHLLIKCGGHEGAGGFSVEASKVEEFAVAFRNECDSVLKNIEREPTVWADTEVSLAELKVATVKELQTFEPFGVGNASPQLMAKDLTVKEVTILKGSHLKIQFSDGTRSLVGFLWRQTEHPAVKVGAKVNLVFKPDINTYNGSSSIQANLQALELQK